MKKIFSMKSTTLATLLCTSFAIPGMSKAELSTDQYQRQEIIRQVLEEAPEGDLRVIRREVRDVARREDIINLPLPLFKRVLELAARPHSYLPLTTFSETGGAS